MNLSDLVVFTVVSISANLLGCTASVSDQGPDNSPIEIAGPAVVRGGQTGSVEPLPPAYWTISQVVPEDGATGVKRDEPIVVIGNAFFPEGLCFSKSVASSLRIEVTEVESDVAVGGELSSWRQSGPDFISSEIKSESESDADVHNADSVVPADENTNLIAVWRPSVPLKPNAEYSLRVDAVNGGYFDRRPGGPPSDAYGDLSYRATFTTSDTVLPPLTLDQNPSVEYFSYQAEILDCSSYKKSLVDTCTLSYCQSTGETQPAIFARVSFGPLSGGAEQYPYQAALWFSDDLPEGSGDPFLWPPSFYGIYGQVAWIKDRYAFDLSIVIPEKYTTETPCFSFVLKDASGNIIEPETLCKKIPESVQR